LAWRIRFSDTAEKQLSKLDRKVAKRIYDFLRNRIAKLDDPRSLGEALKGSKLGEFWRYRVGDYRIITSIEDNVLTILVITVGNRKDIYRGKY
jgi:mRNA interferase RelE/StbE